MFGVVKLREDLKRLRNEVEGNDVRAQRRIDLLSAQADQQAETIELLTKQIKQLVHVTNCKITSPTPGGEVKKLTEEEIASRDSFNRLFGPGLFYTNPYTMKGRSVLSDLQKGKTSKKKTTKKKK